MDDPVTIFHELGDPTRLRVLLSIIGVRKNVTTIVSELGLSQPQVSYHLRRLKDAGLATEQRDGRWVWYRAHHDTHEAYLRELLDLVSRWTGAGAGDAPTPARGGRGRGGKCGKSKGAGVMRASNAVPRRSRKRRTDDDDRPRVERPRKPAGEMDDFLL